MRSVNHGGGVAYRQIKPNPALEALTEELVELRVRRVLLGEAPKPNEAEIARVSQRLSELERLITGQRRAP
jgi:hypothetical protein